MTRYDLVELVLGLPRRVGESLTLQLERLLYRWAYRLHPERRHRGA